MFPSIFCDTESHCGYFQRYYLLSRVPINSWAACVDRIEVTGLDGIPKAIVLSLSK